MEQLTTITNDQSTWPTGDRLWDFCRAVAEHEGADQPGSAPDRFNNPGDLSKGDEHGQGIIGYHTLPDKEILIIFSAKAGGWMALRTKFQHILNGKSVVYLPSMTLTEIGAKYASDPRWAKGVAGIFGVDPDQPFQSYFA